MRRHIVILAIVIAAAGLTACGPKSDQGTRVPVSTEGTTAETEKETSEEGETTEGAGQETGESRPSSGEETGGKGESSPGTGDGSQPPSVTGTESGNTAVTDRQLAEIHEAVKAAYGETYIPNMAYDEVMLEEQFGIKKDWYDAYVAEGPMISAHVETFIGVKAKSGNVADVEKALTAYRKNQLEAGIQYPMNMSKLEASQVLTRGNYVFFVMLGSPALEAEEKGEDAALESAKENNQIGIDVIDRFFQS